MHTDQVTLPVAELRLLCASKTRNMLQKVKLISHDNLRSLEQRGIAFTLLASQEF